MEENNLEAKRRNMVVSSALLSIFYLGGGQITDDKSGTLGLLFVSLDRPMFALGAAWVAWLYFIWRFYTGARNQKDKTFELDIVKRIFDPAEESPLLDRMIEHEEGNDYKNPFFMNHGLSKPNNQQPWKKDKDAKQKPIIKSTNTEYRDTALNKRLKIKFGFCSLRFYIATKKTAKEGDTEHTSIPVYVSYKDIRRRSEEGSPIPPRLFHDAIFHDPGFSETVLPWLMIPLVFLSVLGGCIWNLLS